jgi:hypothetical protein
MDSNNQQGQAQPQQPQHPQAQPQAQIPPAQISDASSAAAAIPASAPVMPALDPSINGIGIGISPFQDQLLNQVNPDAMATILPLIQDPSMAAVSGVPMPGAEALLMQQNMMGNGHLPPVNQPKPISAGKLILSP